VLVIHGTADTIVPLCYGRRLFEAAPPTSGQSVAKTFAELRGAGHNDILYVARDEYRKSVRDFLDRVASVP
jgi:pimeloyl-ACP methyl ester carboxylesterase